MIQKVISLFLAFVISFVSIIEPASAAPVPSGGKSSSRIENHGNNASYSYDRSFNNYYTTEKDSDGAFVAGVKLAVGVTVACYALDGVVTIFFPPAIAGGAVCGYVPGLVAGGAVARAAAGAF